MLLDLTEQHKSFSNTFSQRSDVAGDDHLKFSMSTVSSTNMTMAGQCVTIVIMVNEDEGHVNEHPSVLPPTKWLLISCSFNHSSRNSVALVTEAMDDEQTEF